MTMAKESTLKGYKSKIKWTTDKTLPMMQGMAINEVIKRYNIPAKSWGYSGSIIGVETSKQYLFWKDLGSHLEFKGILDK
jgi:hypothetical protein